MLAVITKYRHMRKVLFLILMNLPILLFSQTEYGSYNWDTFAAPQNQDTIKCVNGVAVMLERRIFEIYVNPEKSFEEIFVYHRKIKTDSHDALASFNKIYVSLDRVIDIVNIQARFISANGKVTNLPKESIKEINNLDNEGDYKTFAIEGAEVGGQIEYFYVLRRKFDAQSGYYLQDQISRNNEEVIFTYPAKLAYRIKSYNNLPAFKTDTSNPEKVTQKLYVARIPAVEEEKYANYKASLMRFEYTLTHNHYNSMLKKYSWGTASQNTYANLYVLSKEDKSAVGQLCKQIVPQKGSSEQKIRIIENWIKSNISIKKEIADPKDLNELIKLKQANKSSVVKLFIAILNRANIDFELVGTGSNSLRPFDPEFNCINFIDHYLIYFPDINQYLTPDDVEYRLNLISPEYQGQYGLFMYPVSYNEDIKTLGYRVGQIPVQDHTINTDSMLINLNLNSNGIDIEAKVHRSITGALGAVFQNVFPNIPSDKKNEIAEQVFRMGKQTSHISSLEIKNDQPDNIGLHPIIFDIALQPEELVENAGNDLLFHIGETIGQQAELYQEQSRKLPIHVGVLHRYYRKIIFQIPEGYTVANPENLDMNVSMKNGDQISCTFTSQAEVKGNQLIVISHEYYNDETYPASRYPEFRDVINASADFNKKTVLLKKL